MLYDPNGMKESHLFLGSVGRGLLAGVLSGTNPLKATTKVEAPGHLRIQRRVAILISVRAACNPRPSLLVIPLGEMDCCSCR